MSVAVYVYVKEGPHGEKPGVKVSGHPKMNGLVTVTGKFIPWHYVRPVGMSCSYGGTVISLYTYLSKALVEKTH